MPRKVYANDSARDLAKKNKILIKDITSSTDKVSLKEVKDYLETLKSSKPRSTTPKRRSYKPPKVVKQATKAKVDITFILTEVPRTKKNYDILRKWYQSIAPDVAIGFPLERSSLKIKNTKKTDGHALNATFTVNSIDSIDIRTTIDSVLDPDQNVENYLMTDMGGNIKPNGSPGATEYLSPRGVLLNPPSISYK